MNALLEGSQVTRLDSFQTGLNGQDSEVGQAIVREGALLEGRQITGMDSISTGNASNALIGTDVHNYEQPRVGVSHRIGMGGGTLPILSQSTDHVHLDSDAGDPISPPDNVGEEEDDILELELGSSGRADVKDDENSRIN